MKKIMKEVGQELLLVFTGKSLDVIIPPVLFLFLLRHFTLLVALLGSLFLSISIFIWRLKKKENRTYSMVGTAGVMVALVMTYITQNASNFFLPDIIGTSFLILISIVSLMTNRPFASYVSHITRGWDYQWFLRDDVSPAYRDVTVFWLGFFVMRLVTEVYLYVTSTVEQLVIANVILGFPITILVLVISYVYGMYRLRQLGGPGVDEYMDNKEPPWRGQTRGF